MRKLSRRIPLAICMVSVALLGTLLALAYGVRVDAALRGGEGGGSCPISHPIEIQVSNYTLRRLVNVSVELEAWRNSYSNNILNNRVFRFTKILKPFESGSSCFADHAFDTDVKIELTASEPEANLASAKRIDRISELTKRSASSKISTKERLDIIDEINRLSSARDWTRKEVIEPIPAQRYSDYAAKSMSVEVVVLAYVSEYR